MIDELKTKRILLTRGQFALVDSEDFDYLNQWSWYAVKDKRGNFYAISNSKIDSLLEPPSAPPDASMARVILGLNVCNPLQADHINHNTLNNKKSNLRKCTRTQNQGNRKIESGGTSKYKGVSWHRRGKIWQARLGIDGQLKYLGTFENERTAAFAYNLAAKKHFGKFAKLNKI